MVKVSILITNYNYGKYIGKAIRSCMEQPTLADKFGYEVIIVDDGSTDDSKIRIETLAQSFDNIKAVFLPNDRDICDLTPVQRLSRAINVGLQNCTGAYVIRLDSDDWFKRDSLYMLAVMLDEKPNTVSHVWGQYWIVNEEGAIISSRPQSDVLGCNIMYRMSNLEQIGFYDEGIEANEDKNIFERYNDKWDKGFCLPVVTYKYFKHSNSLSDLYQGDSNGQ